MLIKKRYSKLISNAITNLESNAVRFFIIEEAKETVLDFSQGTVKVF